MYRIGRTRLYSAIIIVLLVESTFAHLFNIGDLHPSLTLLFVLFIGLHSDWKISLEAGVATGLLKDILSADPSGVNSIVLGLCGLCAHFCKSKVFKDNFFTQILLTLLISILINALTIFVMIVIRNAASTYVMLTSEIIQTALSLSLYTALIAPPAFFCLKRLLRVSEQRF